MGIIKNILFGMLCYFILFNILYGIGRLIHVFPPYTVIYHFYILHKIKQIDGINNLSYAIELDKISDIYYQNEFEKWGLDKRKEAIKIFESSTIKNSLSYADCLFKHIKKQENSKQLEKYIHLCKSIFKEKNDKNELSDYYKRRFIEIIQISYEVNNKNIIKDLELSIKLYDTIKLKEKEDKEKLFLSYLMIAKLFSENYNTWIEAQTYYDKLINRSHGITYINTTARIHYASLLVKIQNFKLAEEILLDCNSKERKKYPYIILYKKVYADVLRGLGRGEESFQQVSEISILNYMDNLDTKFYTLFHQAYESIEDNQHIKSSLLLNIIDFRLRGEDISNSMLFYKYYLKILYNLKFSNKEDYSYFEIVDTLKNVNERSRIDIQYLKMENARKFNKKSLLNNSLDLFEIIQNYTIKHFKYLTENERLAFWNQFENTIPLIYQASALSDDEINKSSLMYNISLFSKGITLAPSIEFSKLLLNSKDSTAIVDYYHLLHLREKDINDDKVVQQAINNIERRLIKKSHIFGDYTKIVSKNWKDIQYSMSQKDVAIEFIVYPDSSNKKMYSALILKKNYNVPILVDLFHENEVSGYLDSMSPNKLYSKDIGGKLTNIIWGEIMPYISPDEEIFFSPEGILHKIAIESLPYSNAQSMDEKYRLYRVTSTRQLTFERKNTSYDSAILYGGLRYNLNINSINVNSRQISNKVKGNRFVNKEIISTKWVELPKTIVEVDSISKILSRMGIANKKITEFNGTEESFKSLSGKNVGILHLATHGFFLDHNNTISKRSSSNEVDILESSGLILSGANNKNLPQNIDDGIITSKEISEIDLSKNDMVILSACNTGLGVIKSDGVWGLQRAFKKAGSQTLVMSLWRINDNTTSEFMISFYKYLLNGNTKNQAFVKAKRFIKNKYPDPLYWAPFIMVD